MRRLLALPLLLTATLSFLAKPVAATKYQECKSSSTCTLGEFLYDDSYTPLPGQACTLSIQNPSGTTILTNAAMTDRGDGWYSYIATTDTTTGLYTATMCCTPTDGKICLDKSYEVKASTGTDLTASDIWNYPTRTMTSYGSLVSDIWNYSTRTLTSFGGLVSDIWSSNDRTLTSFGNLVSDVWGYSSRTNTSGTSDTSSASITAELKTQRAMLEKLVNQPIVTTSLTDADSRLETKLTEATTRLAHIRTGLDTTKDTLLTLVGSWDRLSPSEQSRQAASLFSLSTSTAWIQDIAWFQSAWDYPVTAASKDHADTLIATLTRLQQDVQRRTPTTFTSLEAALTALNALDADLGDVTSRKDVATLTGLVESIATKKTALSGLADSVKTTAGLYDTLSVSDQASSLIKLEQRLRAESTYPGTDDMLRTSGNPTYPKNRLYTMQALINLNRAVLAANVGEQVQGVWLEDGSVIMRASMYNPSTSLTQTVPLKLYLPKEIKPDDILHLDTGLTSTYDAVEEKMVVTGSYTLPPLATQTVAIEMQDIWQLDQNLLTS